MECFVKWVLFKMGFSWRLPHRLLCQPFSKGTSLGGLVISYISHILYSCLLLLYPIILNFCPCRNAGCWVATSICSVPIWLLMVGIHKDYPVFLKSCCGFVWRLCLEEWIFVNWRRRGKFCVLGGEKYHVESDWFCHNEWGGTCSR